MERLQWISAARLANDVVHRLLPQVPPDIVGIVGIPRSGMLPAGILASMLHLPLYGLNSQLVQLRHGLRGTLQGDGRLLLVDDSVFSGAGMARARETVKGDVLSAAVYVTPGASRCVDLYAATLTPPHLLEWNLFNSGQCNGHTRSEIMAGGIASDFDGILCHDPLTDDDNGTWIPNAMPRYLPRSWPIRLVITGRLERWRLQTMAWLERWKCRVGSLVMNPAEHIWQRRGVPEWKARIFKESGASLFIESDPLQAQLIAALSGKQVLCPLIGVQ